MTTFAANSSDLITDEKKRNNVADGNVNVFRLKEGAWNLVDLMKKEIQSARLLRGCYGRETG